eukprot:CAMPEP_0172687636 /NCGR_PEP_ID=MMETSP1074-20121228/21829_1 /TAXON_ID=2916 /ORGANISM="Ceratium fusus, Strain PA161109" /LENGTH=72 /DNA_ID=CAMNT_0013507131 /DNA_START=366 /DNA_END=584 /DNA_ORIENTATION=+
MRSPRCIANMMPSSVGTILNVFGPTGTMLLDVSMNGRGGTMDMLPGTAQVSMDMMPCTSQPVSDALLTKQGC